MLGCFPAGLAGVEREKWPGRIERRALGKTGRQLSVIGFGGLLLKNSTPAQAAEWVREAYEAGVNYFDVAPSYGNSEERLGPALEPFRRDVFPACKTTQRRRTEAAAELRQIACARGHTRRRDGVERCAARQGRHGFGCGYRWRAHRPLARPARLESHDRQHVGADAGRCP